jgi:hypothetical protein
MTDTQKNAPKGSNGTATRVTASDSVEIALEGPGTSSNNRHNGNTKSTTPQKATSTHPGSNGDSKDGSAGKSGKKRRKVNHGA